MKVEYTHNLIVISEANDEDRKYIQAIAKKKPIPPDLITGSQVAEICCCHPKSVSRWAAAGLIRKIHIGRRKVLYDSAEIANFARTGTNHTTAVGGVGSESTGGLVKSELNGDAACL